MVKSNVFKKAFTFAEMMIALVAIGVLVVLTLKVVLKQTPDKDKALFKKAYTKIELAVSELINDLEIYPNDQGFAYTLAITDESGQTYGTTSAGVDGVTLTNGLNAVKGVTDGSFACGNNNTISLHLTKLSAVINTLAQTYEEGSSDRVNLRNQAAILQNVAEQNQNCIVGSQTSFDFTSSQTTALNDVMNTTIPILQNYKGTQTNDTLHDANSKFAEAFRAKFDTIDDNIECMIAGKNNEHIKTNSCFMADDGIVYGIPVTNFKTINVVEIPNNQGEKLYFVPITLYVNYDKIKGKNDTDTFLKEAFFIGVNSKGNIRLLNNVNCEEEQYKNYKQCLAKDYLKSITIRNTKGDK